MAKALESLAGFVQSRKSAWSDARSELEKKWEEAWRTYRCYESAEDKSRESERSQIKLPATREAVNMAVDAEMQILMASDPWFDIAPRNAAHQNRASLFKDYLVYLFDRENLVSKLERALVARDLLGTTIFKIEPRVVIDRQVTRISVPNPDDPQNPDAALTQTVVNETPLTHPTTRIPNLEDIFIDPTALSEDGSIDHAEGVIERTLMHRARLIRDARDGLLDPKAVNALLVPIVESATPSPDGANSESLITDVQRGQLEQTGLTQLVPPDTFEVLDWWGWVGAATLKQAGVTKADLGDENLDIEGDGGAEVHLVVSGHEVLKMAANPYAGRRPFIVSQFEPIPGQLFGLGIAEIASGPQRALDATVRSRMDNKALAINQVFGLNVRKLVAGQNLKLYPGKAFLFDGPPAESLQPMPIPDVTGNSYQEAAEWERYTQMATGVSRIIGGMPTKGGEQTAHEIQTLLNQSNGRIRRIAERTEREVLRAIMRWYHEIIMALPNASEMVRITDPMTGQTAVVEFTSGGLVGEFDFIPQGVTTIAKQNRANKLLQLMAQTANPMDAPYVNRPYIVAQVVQGLGLNDWRSILAPPPPPANPQLLPPPPDAPAGPGGPSGGVGSMPNPMAGGGGRAAPQPGAPGPIGPPMAPGMDQG